ncbi:MAG: 1-acyl-sn-glycerol-3-phosphate acyltransferase [Clostridia bacterium]|nr:1-acyl-sn-glycerol-3-phosphate acyltransferase [Clostridia bacterium]
MKTAFLKKSYEEVMALPRTPHKKPIRPNIFFRTLIRVLSAKDLIPLKFSYVKKDMEKAGEGPYLILMNHSCFLDMEIASAVLYPLPYGIVTTSDGFVGKDWLMRQIGCIPTQKFVSDLQLVRDMDYMLKKNKTSVLMYPEASYSFDGRATPLPRKIGGLLKLLKVPVISIHVDGAFLRTPLYNELKNRKAPVSAEVKCLLTPEEIREKSVEELDAILDEAFNFDHFKWQKENNVRITEKDRAEGLERVLYKCPHCQTEGKTRGEGEHLTCHACGKVWHLTELGEMQATQGETEFSHIPDWYDWERACVRHELEEGTYSLETDVEIGVLVDHKAIYLVGEGHLSHNNDGFLLTGCDGKLEYIQKPRASYTVNADYYFYERGDIISLGNRDCLYYCFIKGNTPVAKARLAAEELFKISLPESRRKQ